MKKHQQQVVEPSADRQRATEKERGELHTREIAATAAAAASGRHSSLQLGLENERIRDREKDSR